MRKPASRTELLKRQREKDRSKKVRDAMARRKFAIRQRQAARGVSWD